MFSLVVCVVNYLFSCLRYMVRWVIFSWQTQKRMKNNCLVGMHADRAKIVCYLSSLPVQNSTHEACVLFWKSQPASTISYIVAANGYYCVLQVWASSFGNWWRCNPPPGAPFVASSPGHAYLFIINKPCKFAVIVQYFDVWMQSWVVVDGKELERLTPLE